MRLYKVSTCHTKAIAIANKRLQLAVRHRYHPAVNVPSLQNNNGPVTTHKGASLGHLRIMGAIFL